MKETDVVYVLGTGSGWNNNEIRFSLRSIEKYGINVGKIFIVGVLPNFLSPEVIHIPANDIFIPSVNADGNIILKVLAACADKRLSEDFLFINDDHVLLKPIDIARIPAFHKGDMNTFADTFWTFNYWRTRLKRTMETLNEMELPAYHFDCHTPILFNKKLFPEVISRFDYATGVGLTMKSLYGNIVYAETGKMLKGEKKKVFDHLELEQISQRLANCGFMSFNDSGLNKQLKMWLYKQFPVRSKWETSDLEDRYLEILQWLDSDREFMRGVLIFEKYMHGVNLLRMFRSAENEYLRKKLEYKLTHAIDDL